MEESGKKVAADEQIRQEDEAESQVKGKAPIWIDLPVGMTLLPCPFCGAEPRVRKLLESLVTWHYVTCFNCFARGGMCYSADVVTRDGVTIASVSPTPAIEAWNARVKVDGNDTR